MKLDEIITLDSLKHHTKLIKTPDQQLADAMYDCGIESPTHIIWDGEIHRFSTGKSGDKSGWYVAFSGEIHAAAFGCWKNNLNSTWRVDIGRSLSMIEEMQHTKRMAEAKAKRDAEASVKREEAKETAKELLINSSEASPDHPYLLRKGIQAHGARISTDGRLMIPMALDGHDDIVSLQYISNDSKMFLKGGAAKGAWWHIGKMQGIQKVFVAEGFATAATIYEQTGIPCAIAFSAGNIHATVKSLRELVGITCSITICADLDESGIGLKCANEAATQSSANVILSPAKSDFNDAFQSGIDIIPILCPAIKADFLLPLSEFCKKPSPIKWLVKKWIQSEGLCMVHGPSGCGKTFVVIDWMCRIASNMTDWSGSQVSDGTVVYLAGEGHQGLKGRFEAWSRNFYGGNTGGIDIFISKEGCDLNTPNGYILARESILSTQKQPVCIVIDTLHRFMVGDENSAQDAGTMIKCCALLQKEFNCTVLLVHHTGVNEETQHRARGSSAWKGALETEISVKQNKAKQIEIISRKTKDSEPPESKFFELRSIILDGWDDEDGEKYTSAVLIQDEYGEQMASKNQNSEFEKAKNEFNLMYFDLNVEKQAGFGVSEAAWKKWGVDKLEKSETAAIKYKQRIKKILIEQSFIHELNGFYYLTNDE